MLAQREGGTVDARGRKVRSVAFAHPPWTIVLDTMSDGESSATRMRVPFRTMQPLRLSLRRHDALTRFGARLGMAGLQVPDPAVDRAFLVRSDHVSVTRSLVLDRHFARALLALRRGRLEVGPVRRRLRTVPNAGEVTWTASGTIKDLEVLQQGLNLMRAAATALARLGIMRAPL